MEMALLCVPRKIMDRLYSMCILSEHHKCVGEKTDAGQLQFLSQQLCSCHSPDFQLFKHTTILISMGI